MTKYFCDRCGKEVGNLIQIKIPSKKTNFNSFETKPIQVCDSCQKEFDDINKKLLDIRFILFSDFMKGGG